MIDKIDINDWSSFVENNDNIMTRLDYICSNTNNIISNVYYLNDECTNVNSIIGSLEVVEMAEIPAPSDLESEINNYSISLVEGVSKVGTSLNYLENVIEEYSKNGTINEEEIVASFNRILSGEDVENSYNFVEKSYKNKNRQGYNFLANYADSLYDSNLTELAITGCGFLTRTGAKSIMKSFVPSYWINATVATGFGMVYDFIMDLTYYDKGGITTADIERSVVDIVGSGTKYASTYAIAGLLAKTGFSLLGGPIGGIAAYVLATPIRNAVDYVVKHAKGDDIIDTFEYDGVTYEIPKNGLGENGDYNALLDKADDSLEEYYIAGSRYSKSTYKTLLYKDWKDVVTSDGKDLYSMENAEDTMLFDAMVREVASGKYTSWEQARQKLQEMMPDKYGSFVYFKQEMEMTYDFSFEEYYYYTHSGGYSPIYRESKEDMGYNARESQ